MRRLFLVVLAGAATIGAAAAIYYARQDLTLSHYDARGHLVVARRIADSLTPGWRQIGAVWLPLPHLVNAWPVQSDWAYRTGIPATAISVGAMAVGLAALAGFLHRRTGSMAAAIAAPTVILLNPNVLYLQSTPMTEPLLFGLSFLAVAAMDRWISRPDPASRTLAGAALAALLLTRYEGWCIAFALVGIAVAVTPGRRVRALTAFLPYMATAIGGFLLLGYGSTGRWFVTSGFFVPDNPSFHRPWAVLQDLWTSTVDLGGLTVVCVGLAGALLCLIALFRANSTALTLALAAAGALPAFAFYQGHPHRVRYMVPLVAACGALAGVAIARLPPRVGAVAAVVLCLSALYARPPLGAAAPMVTEAQWETPLRREREAVTRYLRTSHDGTPILASMGSLGHYVQESSSIGLDIADFVHEGNGDLWAAALQSPRTHVNWVLIEHRAEGGDVLDAKWKENREFLEGFEAVASGGGVVLYRRRGIGRP